MKTLEEIKNEVAKKFQGYNSWDFMAKNDPVCLSNQEMLNEVAKRYAQEACEGLRERIAENAKISQVMNFNSKGQHRGWNHIVDKQSILETEIILP